MNINPSRKIEESTTSIRTFTIDFSIEIQGEDYHDSIIEVIGVLSNIASGGHYEPKSTRDAELANKLYEVIYPAKWKFTKKVIGGLTAIEPDGTKHYINADRTGELDMQGLPFTRLFNKMIQDLS